MPPRVGELLHVEQICGISVPIYQWIQHRDYHCKRPTAFCALAITGLEGVYFAATSVLVLLVFPTSSLVQYGLGSFMLVWSTAHDSDGVFNHEHRDRPDTNCGLLGFVDILCGTMWPGEKYDNRGPKRDSGWHMYAKYRQAQLGRLHEFLHDRPRGILPKTNAGTTWE